MNDSLDYLREKHNFPPFESSLQLKNDEFIEVRLFKKSVIDIIHKKRNEPERMVCKQFNCNNEEDRRILSDYIKSNKK